jgi:hypothetical protein
MMMGSRALRASDMLYDWRFKVEPWVAGFKVEAWRSHIASPLIKSFPTQDAANAYVESLRDFGATEV